MFEAKVTDSGKIVLTGRFDASQVEEAKKVFDQVQQPCTVDFKDLEYISSAGLGVLLGVQKRLSESGGGLKLINMNRHIRDVFRYAGFDTIFEIV